MKVSLMFQVHSRRSRLEAYAIPPSIPPPRTLHLVGNAIIYMRAEGSQ